MKRFIQTLIALTLSTSLFASDEYEYESDEYESEGRWVYGETIDDFDFAIVMLYSIKPIDAAQISFYCVKLPRGNGFKSSSIVVGETILNGFDPDDAGTSADKITATVGNATKSFKGKQTKEIYNFLIEELIKHDFAVVRLTFYGVKDPVNIQGKQVDINGKGIVFQVKDFQSRLNKLKKTCSDHGIK